jgi:SAM-dependent methyltransferase
MNPVWEAHLASRAASRRDGVYYLSDPAPFAEKELRYWRMRAREVRLYSDEVVRRLPYVPPDHPLVSEWAARAESLSRLVAYVARMQRALTVLDLGCGNGWLANHLACLPSVHVCGLDLNRRELAQGARVFVDNLRLKFLYADVFSAEVPERSFDLIVLASVIQYFPDPAALVRRLTALLVPGGELHILDSPLYAPAEVAAAQARTRAYYLSKGLREMTAEYHHHALPVLAPFQPVFLYNPRAWWNRVARKVGVSQGRSPFPWIRLTPTPDPSPSPGITPVEGAGG